MKTRLMTLTMVLMFAASIAFGQEATAPKDESHNEVKIVRLENADASEVSRIVSQTMNCRTGVDRRTNSVVITGLLHDVQTAADFLHQLDQPTPGDNIQSALIRIGESESILKLLETRITFRTQAAFDKETGMLSLRGPENEIRDVQELIAALENQQRGSRDGAAVRASFFFLRGSLEPEEADEDAPPMPSILEPALEVLTENGFYNASLFVPLMVRAQSGEPFEVAGRIEIDGSPVRIRIEGQLEIEDEKGVANLHVACHVTRVRPKEKEMDTFPAAIVPLFDIESELTARIGDIIVLAASPVAGEGDMVALVVRLVPAK